MRIALGQINTSVGDIAANVDKIVEQTIAAHEAGAQIVLMPELAVSGYPPEDLLLRMDFLAACEAALGDIHDRLRAACHPEPPALIVGCPLLRPTGLVNSAVVLGASADLEWGDLGRYDKMHLPNYAVFDERRYFRPGSAPGMIEALDDGEVHRIGLNVCEDNWIPDGPMNALTAAGCTVMLNISASPYHMDKPAQRERMLTQRAIDTSSFIVYCNQVGGQDELVFDGASLVISPTGEVIARGAFCAEDLIIVDIDPREAHAARLRDIRVRELAERTSPNMEAIDGVHQLPTTALNDPPEDPLAAKPQQQWPQDIAQLHEVLCLAIREYVRKNGFERVLLGVSGGVDSAVVAALAADALGPHNVIGITMPSRFNSSATLSDAHVLMQRLGIERHEIPIQSIMESYHREGVATSGLSAENIQPRIRGTILMSHSNDMHALVLACGNKSEYAVGYATLYGDTCGGFAPLRDVGKLRVFELARYLNQITGDERIPPSIIERPPSAELAEDQKDTDILPDYDVLDPLLAQIVERDQDGLNQKVEMLVKRAEFKRRQAPPGPKVTAKAFGRDRRMPIANGWNAPLD